MSDMVTRRRKRLAAKRRLLFGLVALGVAGILYGVGGTIWVICTGAPDIAADDPQALEKIATLDGLQRREALHSYGRNLAEARLAQSSKSPPHSQERPRVSESLSREDRRAMHEGVRQVFQERMRKRIDDFFALTEAERVVELDRRIDEWMTRRKEWEKRRAARTSDASRRRSRRSRNLEHRLEHFRERLDHSTPEDRAKRQAYFQALRARAIERGISLRSPRRSANRRS